MINFWIFNFRMSLTKFKIIMHMYLLYLFASALSLHVFFVLHFLLWRRGWHICLWDWKIGSLKLNEILIGRDFSTNVSLCPVPGCCERRTPPGNNTVQISKLVLQTINRRSCTIPSRKILLVESSYYRFHIKDTIKTLGKKGIDPTVSRREIGSPTQK